MSQRAIKSAARTLALFEAFSTQQRPMTVGEVRKSLGIPQAGASMLLGTLVELGYLNQDRQNRTYRPTIRLTLLGAWLQRENADMALLAPRLAEVQAAIGETAYICMQNGPSAQYVLIQEGHLPERLNIVSDQMCPIVCSAGGRALLSLQSDDEIQGWIRRTNAEVDNPEHRVVPGEFLEMIANVRRTGVAETAGTWTPGMAGIAAPIISTSGGPPQAVGVGGPIARIAARRGDLADALKAFKSGLHQRARAETPATAYRAVA